MKNICIHDVGLRDGLQMESELVPLITKEEWADNLINSGIDIVQLGSFVNPKKVIQMQDTDELFEIFTQEGKKPENTILSALVLNARGLERGLKCGVDLFCMGVSASETHSMKNTGMNVDQALSEILSMAKTVIVEGRKVQVSVQSAFGCGFEGRISEDKVYSIVDKYINAGITIISLADTAGHANPDKAGRMFSKVLQMDKTIEAACHFHNTYGMGLANIYAAMNVGVKYFETSFGGLGGCPFTKQPSGNVATEDFVNMLNSMDLRTDIKIGKIIRTVKHASNFFVRSLPGYVYKTGTIN